MRNPWLEKAKKILESNLSMCLATVDGKQPWISPVYFSFDEHLTFYFVSKPTSSCPFLARQPPSTGEGVWVKGRASQVSQMNCL